MLINLFSFNHLIIPIRDFFFLLQSPPQGGYDACVDDDVRKVFDPGMPCYTIIYIKGKACNEHSHRQKYRPV